MLLLLITYSKGQNPFALRAVGVGEGICFSVPLRLARDKTLTATKPTPPEQRKATAEAHPHDPRGLFIKGKRGRPEGWVARGRAPQARDNNLSGTRATQPRAKQLSAPLALGGFSNCPRALPE